MSKFYNFRISSNLLKLDSFSKLRNFLVSKFHNSRFSKFSNLLISKFYNFSTSRNLLKFEF